MASSSNAVPEWSTRIPRKRNRSTSTTNNNNNNNNNNPTTSTDHSMTHHEQQTQNNSPSRQIFQHFPSWSSLTNSNLSPPADPQPPKKRRKGVAGAILSTALEAALFTSAIGYAAYNFWCGNGLEEEETTRLSPKARLSGSSIPNQSLSSLSPPPPYEPSEQLPEQIRMARAPRKSMSTRSVANNRHYPSRPTQSSSIPSDPLNFILRPNPIPSINYPLNLQDENELINHSSKPYTHIPLSEPIITNELDDEEDEEDDEELKAFRAQIQGLIKEGKEALASKPSIPNSIAHSSSSTSLHLRSFSKINIKSRPTTTNANLQTIVTSTDKANQPLPQLDENVQLLQLALEKAALPSHSNWWER